MSQQVAPPSTPYGVPIDIATAKKVMAAAESEAVKNGWCVAIAIVDSGANLVMLQRLDNAQLSSVRIAEQKARTAADFGGRPRCSRMRWPAAASGSAC